MNIKRLTLTLLLVLIAYLLFWPVPVNPIAWQAPVDKGYSGDFATNSKLANLEHISIDGDYGPEDLALDSKGNLAISLHSGAIMTLAPGESEIQPWVSTGGRPLGIEFDKEDNLIVADAFKGLLSISPDGDITVLANSADGLEILYADDLDIASDGKIYFSDASVKFSGQQYGGTLEASLLDILEHGGQGRLLVYDPISGETHTLKDELNFANGVALSADERSVLVNETGTYRVIRYWLQGQHKGQTEVVIDNLPGFPDNLARSEKGGYWLGLASPRSKALDNLSEYPLLRKMVQRLPAFMRPQARFYGHVVRFSDTGQVLESLQDPSGAYPLTTGVVESKNYLYISSLTAPVLARKEREKGSE